MKNLSCFKEFIKYSLPNVLGMLGLSGYILADTFFVAKGLGANGLAALNLAIPIYSFIQGIGLMLGIGAGIKFSILKSQNNKHDANIVFTNAIYLACFFAIVLFMLGLFCSETIITLMGASADVLLMSTTYLQVILLFSPMFIINNVLLCFIRNDGAPKLAMASMLGASATNVVLDYVFIFHFQMGIFGAAFATGLAPIVSMLILSSFIFKQKNNFHFYKCNVSKKIGLNIFSGGLPALVTEFSSGLVIIIFNMIILKLQGNIGVAAYGVIANISLVVIAIYTGIAQGIQPIISKNYGLDNRKNVQAILHYAIVSVVIISSIIYTGIFFGAEQIVSFFNSEANQQLQHIAVYGLKLYFLGSIFAGLNIIISAYFVSTECSRPAHIISTLRGFVIIVPLAFLLSFIAGMTGVWSAFFVTELLVSLIAFVLYFKYYAILPIKNSTIN